MGRTVVRPLDRQRNRRSRDRLTAAVIAVVVLFALIGVGSAGAYVLGKVSGNSPAKKSTHHTGGNASATLALARARTEATSIVKAANDASGSIINSATKKARRQAAGIIAAAHRQAHSLVAAAQPPTPAPQIVPTTSTGTAPISGTSGGTVLAPTAVPVYPAAGQTIVVPGTTRATPPDLRGVPATWQVVGYNATFGAGTGSAGSISVLNRSARAFSGIAVVKYTKGGSASAAFSGLPPGQALVLPLNGPHYNGGGYRIVLQGLH